MIESVSNPGVKLVSGLVTKSKIRKKEGSFVVEGPRMVFETPRELLQRIYVCEEFSLSEEEKEKLQEYKAQGVLVEEVTLKVMKAMSDTVTPQGILAVVKQPSYELEDTLKDCPYLLVLERIQDPGNLGTMFRTAEGAGCTGIIMTKDTVDVFSPKVVRSTMGSLYRMPFYITEDLGNTVSALKEKGLRFYAAALDGKKTYDGFNYTKPVGFFIGNEGNGLSKDAMDMADEKLIIPMSGKLESLNAAMAAGILMYEGARQRRNQ